MSAFSLVPPVSVSKQINFWRLGEKSGDWEYSIVQYSTVQYDVKNVTEGRGGEGRGGGGKGRGGLVSVFLVDSTLLIQGSHDTSVILMQAYLFFE